jgi:hypothetical protein
VLLMPAAALGDRFGRRRVYAAGLGLFAVASAACALAPHVGWLIAARAVHGAGAALIMPVGLALLSTAFPPGPLGRADDADAYVRGIEALSQIQTDLVVHKTFVDGPDVLTWFDLHTTVAPPSPVANWSHVENGRISSVRVTFDARPLAPQTER